MNMPPQERRPLEPGVDFVLNESVINKKSEFYPFPERQDVPTMRHTWMMVRRLRPVVPCPHMCPLPNRQTPVKNCKLLSVYLRPWTLVRKAATAEVPFLGFLNESEVLTDDVQQEPHTSTDE
eukprot:11626044-Karenia_brevis.AAC.1